MEDKYDIVISCGAYLKPTLNRLMHGELEDKIINITGDVTMADIQRIAYNMAISTFNEKLHSVTEDGVIGMTDRIANAFIFQNKQLVHATSVSFEKKRPLIGVYNKEQLDEMMKLTNYHR